MSTVAKNTPARQGSQHAFKNMADTEAPPKMSSGILPKELKQCSLHVAKNTPAGRANTMWAMCLSEMSSSFNLRASDICACKDVVGNVCAASVSGPERKH